MLSHGNLYANTLQSAAWFPKAEPGGEVMLGVLPFFHVFAMTAVMNLSIHLGAKIVMLPRFELDTVMKTIDRKKPTLFPAENGSASCRERVCQYVSISVVAVSLKKNKTTIDDANDRKSVRIK